MKKGSPLSGITLMMIGMFLVPGFCQAQTISFLSPDTSNAGQTLNVTITGSNTHFTQGSGTTVYFGFLQGSSTLNSLNVVSNTSIIANVTIPANTYTGSYDVEVYNNTDGYLDYNNGFYVNGVTPPSITNVSPDTGSAGQTLNVTITGSNTHFTRGSGTTVYFGFLQGSSTLNSLNVVSSTSMIANVTIPANTYTNSYNVEVYDDTDSYLDYGNGFYVNGLTPPSIANVSPDTGNAGQTLNVTITGSNTNFTQGSGTTVYFGFQQGSSTLNSLNVISSTSMIANITIPANTYTDSYYLEVYDNTDSYLDYDNGFYVNGLTPPSIANVSPDTGNAGQTLNVTITGSNTHFTQGSGTTVYFGFQQGSSTINSLNVVSSTSMIANVTIPANTDAGSYNVEVYDGADDYLYYANDFYVNVCSIGSPSITAGGALSFCQGGSVTLNATASNATLYYWSNGESSQSITVTQSGNYSVIASNANGCSSEASPITVTVVSYPADAITANGATSFCAGGNVSLTAPAGDTYHWSNNETTRSISVTQSGSYSVTVTNSNLCSTTSAPVVVSVSPISANFSISADTVPHHYTVVNNATGVGHLRYDWHWGDATTNDTVPYPSHTYADSGLYTICLTVTDSVGCVSTYCDSFFHALRTTDYMIYMTVVPPSGLGVLEMVTQSNNVNIYPNPATNQLTVQSSLFNSNDHVSIIITNVLGEALFKSIIHNPQSQIDVSRFPSGVYFLEVIGDKERWAGKFMKE